ncbi:MAG: hypothetical protein K6G76_06395 [Lachnospiraceae bacterium]|jgi:phosphotransferase system  glucose/maltose/N-acetylglucosamine-specific IIC component|nr:hypothetical protein [Lachnospiraceae bacterium]
MKLGYLRAFIVLLAGLITLIVNIKTGREATVSLLIVLIVICVFYVIGTLICEILQKNLEPKPSGEGEEADEENDDDEEASSDNESNEASDEEVVDEDNF